MPVDINNLTDGWLELESDPGKSVSSFLLGWMLQTLIIAYLLAFTFIFYV